MDPRRNNGMGFQDGFCFQLRYVRNGSRYLICKNRRSMGCQGSAKITDGRFIHINRNHNHPQEDGFIQAREFKRQLQEACVTENRDLRNIYDLVAMRNPDGAVHVPFNSIRASMFRWRQSTTPQIPRNLNELVDILQTGSVVAEGQTAIIFGNVNFLNNFGQSQCTFIDGTFKAVPRRPHFLQILTIFATCMDHAFPVIHIFMERRSRALYDAVFHYVRATFPNFINRTIVTDFEMPLVNSLRMIYPEASLHSCFFHFCQAVLRKAKTLGVLRQIQENPNGKILLRKYYALALLPAPIIPEAFQSLQDNNVELRGIFENLHDYIRRQWIERDTPEHFSVFRQRHRTNNVMESYHRRLNSKLNRHPGVWQLLKTLIEIQNTAALELTQLERHGRVFRVATKNVIFNNQLTQAWDKLEDGRFTYGDFLRQAVHFVEGLDMQLHQWNDDVDAADAEDPPAPVNPLHPPAEIPLNAPDVPPPIQFPIQPPPLLYFDRRLPLPLPDVALPPPVPNELQRPIQPPPLAYFHQRPPPPLPNVPLPPPVPNELHPPIQPPPLAHLYPRPPPPHPDVPLPPPNEPPPLIHFQRRGAEDPDQPPPVLDPDDFPAPELVIPSRSPSPAPLLGLAEPMEPEEIEQLFRGLQNENHEDYVLPRWNPTLPVQPCEEDSLRCKVCYLNKVQYFMTCGHVFCAQCAYTLFNVQTPKCGICRAAIITPPVPVFLT